MANNVELDMEIQGLKELERRLGDPELVRGALRVFGARAASTGKRTAKKAIDGGTGQAKNAIVAKVLPMDGVIFVKSIMPRARAMSIEEGRLPGNPPSLGHIISWKEAVGHPDSGREIRQEISATGVKGKQYLGKVLDQWRDSLPRWLQEAAQRIEKKWKSGR